MGAAYSQDLRDRVLLAYQRGMQTIQIARTFSVSPAWARRVKQRLRDHGETKPRPTGGAHGFKIDPHRLRELVQQQPDATLNELRQMLGVDCCESACPCSTRSPPATPATASTTAATRYGRGEDALDRETSDELSFLLRESGKLRRGAGAIE